MLRDKPFTEYKTVVQYPPDPPRGCGSDPIDMRTGDDAEALPLARHRREWHLNNGATSAVVYERAWTPGPWVEVDGGAGSVPTTASPQGVGHRSAQTAGTQPGHGSPPDRTRPSAERNAGTEPTGPWVEVTDATE